MTETIDYMKTLRVNTSFPSGGTCKICGFSTENLKELATLDPEPEHRTFPTKTNFRFSNVCGLHSCRIKAKVCDCKACQKSEIWKEWLTKALIEGMKK